MAGGQRGRFRPITGCGSGLVALPCSAPRLGCAARPRRALTATSSRRRSRSSRGRASGWATSSSSSAVTTADGRAWRSPSSTGCDYLDLDDVEIDPRPRGCFRRRLARKYTALPVRFLSRTIVLVAVADPTDVLASDDLRLALGVNVRIAVSDEGALARRSRALPPPDVHLEEARRAEPRTLEREGRPARRARRRPARQPILTRAIDTAPPTSTSSRRHAGLVVRARIDGIMRRLTTDPERAAGASSAGSR